MRVTALFSVALVVVIAATPAASADDGDPSLRVRVVTADDESRPVVGARVVVRNRDIELGVTQTGVDGLAGLNIAWPDDSIVEVSGGGHGYAIRRLRGEPGARLGQHADICIPLGPGAPLHGCVRRADTREPIAGARVLARVTEGGSAGGQGRWPYDWCESRTDEMGRFRVEGVGAGALDLQVIAAGFAFVERRVDGLRDAQAFNLEPGGTIRGRVLDAAGQPVPGASLEWMGGVVWSPDGDFAGLGPDDRALAACDDAGRFVFASAPLGVRFSVGLRNGTERRTLFANSVSELRIAPSTPSVDVVLRADGAWLRASLYVAVEAADGRPLDDVDGLLSDIGTGEQVASASGRPIAFRGVSPGRYRLDVAARGVPAWHDEIEIVRDARPTRVTARIGGSLAIEGRVVDDLGAPVPGVAVNWMPTDGGPLVSQGCETGPTGIDGGFRIQRLTAGEYDISPAGHIGMVDRFSAPSTNVRLVVPRRGFFEVRLVAPEGVDLPTSVWTLVAESLVDGDRLRIGPLGVGPQSCLVELHGSRGRRVALPLRLSGDAVAGETTDLGTRTLDPGCSVSGVVLDEDGDPAPNVLVASGLESARTDAAGRFTLASLSPGSAALVAGDERVFASATIDAVAGASPLVLRLTRLRRVRVDCTALAGRVVGARVSVGLTLHMPESRVSDLFYGIGSRYGAIDARGVAVFALPPGEWMLMTALYGTPSAAMTIVTVPPDGDEPLHVVLSLK